MRRLLLLLALLPALALAGDVWQPAQLNCPSCSLTEGTLTLTTGVKGTLNVGVDLFNSVQVMGSTTGNNVQIAASGGDTNVGFNLISKGTFPVVIGNAGADNLKVVGGGSGVTIDVNAGTLTIGTTASSISLGPTNPTVNFSGTTNLVVNNSSGAAGANGNTFGIVMSSGVAGSGATAGGNGGAGTPCSGSNGGAGGTSGAGGVGGRCQLLAGTGGLGGSASNGGAGGIAFIQGGTGGGATGANSPGTGGNSGITGGAGGTGGTGNANAGAIGIQVQAGSGTGTAGPIFIGDGTAQGFGPAVVAASQVVIGTATTTAPVKVAGGSGAFVGSCSMSAGTTCTATVPTGAQCTASPRAGTTSVSSVAVAATTVTVTASAANSNTYTIICL